MITLMMLAGGVALLALGGHYLVDGAAALARRFGLSPLFVGLTFVGMGTSIPELATSLAAVVEGSDGIALGNIVGSNIANIFLVAGATAFMFGALPISRQQLLRDGGCGVIAALLFVIALNTTGLVAAWGLLFVAILVGYLIYVFGQERTVYEGTGNLVFSEQISAAPPAAEKRSIWLPMISALVGLAAVIVGAELTVKAAIVVANAIGVSDTVIGLTLVAVGTSLPEIVASFIAAARGMAAMALGNILGSNLFNILLIGGAVSFVSSHQSPANLAQIDAPVALLGALALMAMAFPTSRLGPVAGGSLLAAYGLYLSTLLLR